MEENVSVYIGRRYLGRFMKKNIKFIKYLCEKKIKGKSRKSIKWCEKKLK